MAAREEDLDCPICLGVFYEPVTPPCGHTFCRLCLDCTLERHARCPLCRAGIDVMADKMDINEDIAKRVKRKFPAELAVRADEVKEELAARARRIRVKLIVGNAHELLDKNGAQGTNNHRWTAFVRPSGAGRERLLVQCIEECVFDLHPTFRPPVVHLSDAPWEVSRIGWGTFQINIKIRFHADLGIDDFETDHYLSFDGAGRWQTVEVEVDREKLMQMQDRFRD